MSQSSPDERHRGQADVAVVVLLRDDEAQLRYNGVLIARRLAGLRSLGMRIEQAPVHYEVLWLTQPVLVH